MARSVKKIDGRSKEARAMRAKTATRKPRAVTTPRKPAKPKDAAPSFDRETSLRILALQMASNSIGRDTAPRDLVPMARQIEEFLTGAAQTMVRVGELSPCMHSPSLDDAEADLRGLRDAEAAFS